MTLLLLAFVGCSPDPDVAVVCTTCDAIGPTPRFARLTHRQWENTVADLLGLPAPSGLSEAFIGDVLSTGGFDNDANVLQVSPELWGDYQRAAETLALQVVQDATLYAAVAPEDPRLSGAVGDAVRVEAEGPDATATTGDVVGDAWMVWSNGEVATTLDISPGRYIVRSAVWGTQAGDEAVQASLRVDGVDVHTRDVLAVSGSSPDFLEATVDLSASPTIAVAFLNDFYDEPSGLDRNLVVDWFEVEPEVADDGGSGTEAWIRRIGRRVHRRPLTDAQVARYTSLFEHGSALELTGEPFRDGVYTTLLAMLQSPHFLYRVELAETPNADGRIALDGYELAAKLSFALTHTAPDDALLEAAEQGELDTPEGLRTAAEALLDSPRGIQAIDHFHHQLLNLDRYANIYKDPDSFPEWSASLNELMAEEARLYSRHAVLDGAGIFGFYTEPHTWVTGELAALYGVDAPDGFTRVDLDPTQRAGILTTTGFLAVNAHADEIDSIHRGVFVNLRLLCADLPPPPAEIAPLPAPEPGLSNRERVDGHTGRGTCGQGCHSSLINPVGFAFENFDALGQWRETDADRPVDATGGYLFEDGPRAWSDPVGFAGAVGASPDAHQCLMRNWMRYTHGREPNPEDGVVLGRIAQRSLSDDAPIRELVLDLVTAENFRFRTPELE